MSGDRRLRWSLGEPRRVINDRPCRKCRRLLITYALAYFAPEARLRDLDEQRVRGFVDWLGRQQGNDGRRLSDRGGGAGRGANGEFS